MQIITRILTVAGCRGTWTDEWNKSVAPPEIAIGLRAKLRFDLRREEMANDEGTLEPLDAEIVRCDSYYLALDSDYLQETDPKLLKTSGFTLVEADGKVILEAEIPNTAVAGLLDAVAAGADVTLNGELGGYNADGDITSAAFVVQFTMKIRNRVYLGGEVPPEVVNDPEYLTAAQVRALIEDATRPEKGDPGLSAYEVAVAGGYAGTVDEWLASLHGADGEDGPSAYDVAVAGGYQGSEEDWLTSLRGEEGKTAYEVAQAAGFTGSVAEWLESLKGQPGQDLKFDATGELSERAVYNDAPQGFTFAATETDSDERTTRLYVFVKRSAEVADWFDPLVITYYSKDGKDGENAALIPPLEFTAPPVGKDYLYFSLNDFPAVTIAAVCIDTDEGEVRLPYDSALGIRKIVKNAQKTVYVYFGNLVPTYATGRIYFAQGVTTGGEGGAVAGKSQYSADKNSWHDLYVSATDRYMRSSYDNGLTWTPAIPLTTGSSTPETRRQYSANGTSWHNVYNAAADIYMRMSFDDGATWSPAMLLTGALDGVAELIAAIAGEV